MWRGSLDASYESQWLTGIRIRTITDQQTGFKLCTGLSMSFQDVTLLFQTMKP